MTKIHFFRNFKFFQIFHFLQKKKFFLSFHKIFAFCHIHLKFGMNWLYEVLQRTVDGFFEKINICWFFIILVNKVDFHGIFVHMEFKNPNFFPWETDKLKKQSRKQTKCRMEMSFHTPSGYISLKLMNLGMVKQGEFWVRKNP